MSDLSMDSERGRESGRQRIVTHLLGSAWASEEAGTHCLNGYAYS